MGEGTGAAIYWLACCVLFTIGAVAGAVIR